VSTWAPHTTALQDKLGSNGVILHDPGLYNMSWNVVSSRELSTRDPETIVRFLRAVLRADRMIAERPAEAIAITADKCGMDIGAVEREWKNFEFGTQLDQTLILNLEDQSRWMIGKKEDDGGKTPNILDYIYTKGLNSVDPDAVRIVSE
jgi:NitT/TauT family transport system substrate-binding protein